MVQKRISQLLFIAFLIQLISAENPNFGIFSDKLQELVGNDKLKSQRNDHMNRWLRAQNAAADNETMKLGVDGFSCPANQTGNSTEPPEIVIEAPTSVHALKPSDINVVAALGDSFTAGNGAGAQNLLEVLLEYRGLSWDIGGDGDLTNMVTLPNILKEFSLGGLEGASTGVSPVWSATQSGLNLAAPGARAADLQSQAQQLIDRMKNDPNIDYENDWKLISVFIGSNDLCNYCQTFFDRIRSGPQQFATDLKSALDLLYDNVPRALVNLVSPVHVELLRQTHGQSLFCTILHSLECPCIVNNNFDSQQMDTLARSYQNLTRGLESSGYYDLRDDFTVVVQPFLEDAHLPFSEGNQTIDLAFFAPDCFHWSQLGHSVVARGLWNSMLQPVGAKLRDFNPNTVQPLKCPDPACPLIRTTKNSANCSAYFEETPVSTTMETMTTPEETEEPTTMEDFTSEEPTTLPEENTTMLGNETTEIPSQRPRTRRTRRTLFPRRTTRRSPNNENITKLVEFRNNEKVGFVAALQGNTNTAESSGATGNYASSIVIGVLLAGVLATLTAAIVYQRRCRNNARRVAQARGDVIVQYRSERIPPQPTSEKTPLLSSTNSNVVKVY